MNPLPAWKTLRPSNRFSTSNEGPLHAALKAWYAQPGDRCEVLVDGFVVDIVQGDYLVEIQTRNFTAIRRKLCSLADLHPVRLVYPVARQKWIIRLAEDGITQLQRRKSPKTGRAEAVFTELVRIPTLLAHPNFSIEILFIQENEVRVHDATRAWRRKGWVIKERQLIQVLDRQVFNLPADLAGFLPASLRDQFTVRELAAQARLSIWLAQKMVYCLKQLEVIVPASRRGRALLYHRA